MKASRELEECKFYPNGFLDKNPNVNFNSNEFYKKNIDWMNKKDALNVKMQNDIIVSLRVN